MIRALRSACVVLVAAGLSGCAVTGCLWACHGSETKPKPESWIGWEQHIDASRQVTWQVGGAYPNYDVCRDWAVRMQDWATKEITTRRAIPGTQWVFLCAPQSFDPRTGS